ncbi:aspartate/tyrosine/aromatic aminotransferase [Croceifilum oryzae]|uniref:Aspartate/tyrosine/aromatic aminotransferase n=1 Tax=Croceifilum oryzae TaxID=1553429 RepID=A0AAJ1TFI7_9BACL|nr:aromatic amino acid transaminase [Croceifilum oryzae]MDQ0416092.1 aspartate/tyrosine/aromatic aminotransferase [Croceifilum oryzae]
MIQTKSKNSIMQLLERYNHDTRTDKLNLTVGVYTDESGRCPILESVRDAEYYRVSNQTNKASFHLAGAPEFHQAVRKLLFSATGSGLEDHIEVIQTVGCSGALYLAGQLIYHYAPTSSIWLSSPTWENHTALLNSNRNNIRYYRYQPANPDELCIDTILEDLKLAQPGDFVLLHACCHNPTGIDPNPAQWKMLAEFCAERELIPLFDFAYQGFADSIEQDAEFLVPFSERLETFIVCNSFSKNMGIYDERTGALTLVFKDEAKRADWHRTVKGLIRNTYSMPPVHGSFIVSHIINDSVRFSRWQQELEGMCSDLHRRRGALFSELGRIGIANEVLTYRNQQGMFVCLNLSEEKIDLLRDQYGIYLLDTGRMCVASLSTANMPRFCETLSKVI